MKAKVSLKMFVLSAALLVVSLATSARSYDNQLIYNPIEENGMTVGQTVYKMDGNTLANYMKYNYKYDDNKRMIESEALKWNSFTEQMRSEGYTIAGEPRTSGDGYFESVVLDPDGNRIECVYRKTANES